jgi:hypothetical protein
VHCQVQQAAAAKGRAALDAPRAQLASSKVVEPRVSGLRRHEQVLVAVGNRAGLV